MTTHPISTTVQWLGRRLPELVSSLRPLPAHAMEELGRRLQAATAERDPLARSALDYLFGELGLPNSKWHKALDSAALPAAGVHPDVGAFVVHQRIPTGGWLIEDVDGARHVAVLPPAAQYIEVGESQPDSRGLYRTAGQLFSETLRQNLRFFVYAAVASVVINLLALMTSLYSMQIYDRVIPTQGLATLYALTAGVGLSVVLELVGKFARAAILDHAIRSMDAKLSHSIFERLLRVRMDQLPSSVGTLSGQLRSYEMIRSFASSVTLYLLVDTPFALFFILVIWMIGGPLVACVPLAFFVLALIVGALHRGAMLRYARSGMTASHRKLGLLVEAVEGAETIKASGAGWGFLARWNNLSRTNIDQDMKLRQMGESASHMAAFLQQGSYVLLVAVGAYVASTTNDLTAGGLIACSILSGRVLTPVGMLPGLMVQWANASSAMTSIAHIFKLEQDNHQVERPLAINRLRGALQFEGVKFAYGREDPVLQVQSLQIRPGEKVGVLGAVGSGKSTLLKLMSGMYRPSAGSVLLDGVDMQHISRAHLGDRLGYLPQDVKLFAGTLRDNLMLGVVGKSEQQMIEACELTGLADIVKGHRKGFDLPIAEGGSGLSGGQRQLLALTRMVLAAPDIWLLDEPTASMDDGTEIRAIQALRHSLDPSQTLVLVTHKPALLQLVDRLVILRPDGVALDGPRDQVLQQITKVRPATPEPQRPRGQLEVVA
jgi:ATP-binding cassette subfamily C protein LapB